MDSISLYCPTLSRGAQTRQDNPTPEGLNSTESGDDAPIGLNRSAVRGGG